MTKLFKIGLNLIPNSVNSTRKLSTERPERRVLLHQRRHRRLALRRRPDAAAQVRAVEKDQASNISCWPLKRGRWLGVGLIIGFFSGCGLG